MEKETKETTSRSSKTNEEILERRIRDIDEGVGVGGGGVTAE